MSKYKKKLKPSEIERARRRQDMQNSCTGCGNAIPPPATVCNNCENKKIDKINSKIKRNQRLNIDDIVTEEDDE